MDSRSVINYGELCRHRLPKLPSIRFSIFLKVVLHLLLLGPLGVLAVLWLNTGARELILIPGAVFTCLVISSIVHRIEQYYLYAVVGICYMEAITYKMLNNDPIDLDTLDTLEEKQDVQGK